MDDIALSAAAQQSDDGCIPPEVTPLRRLSIRQTRRILGIGRTTLYVRMKSGEIEFQRDGVRVFFTADAIAAYQDRQKRHAKEVNTTMS